MAAWVKAGVLKASVTQSDSTGGRYLILYERLQWWIALRFGSWLSLCGSVYSGRKFLLKVNVFLQALFVFPYIFVMVSQHS